MRPHAKKHFRFNPSRAPVRDISPFRGEPSDPFARTFSRAANPASGPSLEKMGTFSASVYRHATADAVGRGFEFFWPCGSESL